MLKAGDKAPNFSLETDRGKTITLAELGDKPVVLFFYPKDDTPGCTIECKEFRDTLPKFEGKAHVLGISGDDQASHVAFREKFGLNFPLLVDAGRDALRGASQTNHVHPAWHDGRSRVRRRKAPGACRRSFESARLNMSRPN